MTKQEAIGNLKTNCIGCCHPQAMEYCERNCEYGIAIVCIEECIELATMIYDLRSDWGDNE